MRKSKPKTNETDKAHLSTLEPGSMEHDTYLKFAEASAKHGALITKLDDPKFEGKNGIPDKHEGTFKSLCGEIDRAREAMFRAFDTYQRTTKHTIHVPEAELSQVIYDALMANREALPERETAEDERSGLADGRAMKVLAREVIEELRAARVQVREENMNAVYCDDCEAELS